MQKLAITHHSILKDSGGAVRVARILHSGLEKAGHDSMLSSEIDEQGKKELRQPGAAAKAIDSQRIIHLHSSQNSSEFLENVAAETKVIATMHDLKLVTGGCPYPLDCPGFFKGCPDPCPRNFRDSEKTRRRSVEMLLKHNVFLVSPSGWLSRLVKKAEPDLSPKVIPNGIPWPDNAPDKKTARAALGINPALRILLFVAHGGIEAQYKAGHRWQSIWEKIKQDVPEAVAFVCGGNDFKVEGDLHFWPYVTRKELGLLMEASDVLAYPTYADNHPLVILEAMSHGLACISYKTGGVSEQLQDKETGILVEYKNEKNFVHETVNMLKHPGQCKTLGQKAYSDGKKKFIAERMVSSYLKKYIQLL